MQPKEGDQKYEKKKTPKKQTKQSSNKKGENKATMKVWKTIQQKTIKI